jgi:hypothetical protein
MSAAFGLAGGIALTAGYVHFKQMPQPTHYERVTAREQARVDADISEHFRQNGYEVTGGIGWGCYHVERKSDHAPFSACVNTWLGEMHIYRVQPEGSPPPGEPVRVSERLPRGSGGR